MNIKHIEDALFRFGDRFLHRILNEEEVAEYVKSPQPARFIAKRFAAKEAFSKAFGTNSRVARHQGHARRVRQASD